MVDWGVGRVGVGWGGCGIQGWSLGAFCVHGAEAVREAHIVFSSWLTRIQRPACWLQRVGGAGQRVCRGNHVVHVGRLAWVPVCRARAAHVLFFNGHADQAACASCMCSAQ